MFIDVGSRDSELARAQSNQIIDQLNDLEDVRAEIRTMESSGDQQDDRAIPEIDETGVFTSRLDRAVVNGDVDVAVHSFKDCPTETDHPLTVAAVPPRTTPMDALVGIGDPDIQQIDADTTIGTSSIRRRANLLHRNPDLDVQPCRGNVPSRLDKLEEGDYDGLVLAMAGLERLEETVKPLRILRPEEILPAPAQGALAVVCHRDRDDLIERLETLDHATSRLLCEAERAFLNEVEGGCQAPVGALGKLSGDQLVLQGTVTHPDGEDQVGGELRGDREEPDKLGRELAEVLLEQGAGEFIQP